MDKQDFLRNLLIAGFAFILIMVVGPRLLPMPPAATPGSPTPAPTAPAGGSGPAPASAATAAAPATPEGSGYTIVEAEEERTFLLGATAEENGASPFRVQLTASNVGASIEKALLTDHAATIDAARRYALLSPVELPDKTLLRSLAVEKINLDGYDVSLHDKRWVARYDPAAGTAGHRVEFVLDLRQGDAPAIRLTRVYTLAPQPIRDGRHDLGATLTVENLSPDPHRVVVTMRGAVGIPQESTTDDRVIDWGVLAPSGHVAGSRAMLLSQAAQKTDSLWAWTSAEPGRRLAWAASGNMYFTCTIAPVDPDTDSVASYVTELGSVDVDGNPITAADVTTRIISAAVDLHAGTKVVYPASVYIGEKDGKAFRAVPEYAARNYYYQIEQGFGWCTFTFLVELMIWLLNSLFFIFRDFGVAIVILVLIVRALLHPITKKGQVNMVRMQHKMSELGPKIEEIKKKYGNDKVRMNQEMMKLDINPAGQMLSCLPMFLQMPIWVALYLSLSNNILMRHESPFYGITWIPDLTAQDALITFSTPITIPLFGWTLTSFNLLPLLVGVFMYIQQKTQPKPKPNPNMTEQQRQQQEAMQRMMPIMSVMMVLIFFKMPSGLNLYIMFSSIFGWIEQGRIRRHIQEQEAAGTLHAPRRWIRPESAEAPERTGKLSWLERLQKAAEEAQKSQQRLPKGKRKQG